MFWNLNTCDAGFRQRVTCGHHKDSRLKPQQAQLHLRMPHIDDCGTFAASVIDAPRAAAQTEGEAIAKSCSRR
jgi:hypothetical protein